MRMSFPAFEKSRIRISTNLSEKGYLGVRLAFSRISHPCWMEPIYSEATCPRLSLRLTIRSNTPKILVKGCTNNAHKDSHPQNMALQRTSVYARCSRQNISHSWRLREPIGTRDDSLEISKPVL